MKPGRELDRLVVEIWGWKRIDDCPLGDSHCPGQYLTPDNEKRCPPPVSTEGSPALEAWKWLENNHPWGENVIPSLCKSTERRPAVVLWEWDKNPDYLTPNVGISSEIEGESYPHAICLAILATTEAICWLPVDGGSISISLSRGKYLVLVKGNVSQEVIKEEAGFLKGEYVVFKDEE